MLLHANRLNADVIEQVLRLFEDKQYQFVSLRSRPVGRCLSNSRHIHHKIWTDVGLPLGQRAEYKSEWQFRTRPSQMDLGVRQNERSADTIR
jgi:hypothetical protein